MNWNHALLAKHRYICALIDAFTSSCKFFVQHMGCPKFYVLQVCGYAFNGESGMNLYDKEAFETW
jgi:hypothetical protein